MLTSSLKWSRKCGRSAGAGVDVNRARLLMGGLAAVLMSACGGSGSGSGAAIAPPGPAPGSITWGPTQRLESFDRAGSDSLNTAIDDTATATAVWTQLPTDTSSSRVYAARQSPGSSWTSPPTSLDAGLPESASVQGASMELAAGLPVAAWVVVDGTARAIRAASFAGGTWGAPVLLSTGDAFNTVVAGGADGTAVALWVESVGADRIVHAAVRTPAGTWSAKRALDSRVGAIDDQPAAAVDGFGNIVAVWRRSLVGGGVRIFAARFVGGVWAQDQAIDSGAGMTAQPQVVVLPNNQYLAAWLQAEPGRFGVRATRFTGAAWLANPAQVFLDAAGDSGQLRLGRAGANAVVAVWEQMPAQLNATSTIRSSRFSTANNLWSTSIAVGATGLSANNGSLSLATAVDGRAVAVFERQTPTVLRQAVYAQFTPSPAPGAWTAPAPIDASVATRESNPVIGGNAAGAFVVIWQQVPVDAGNADRIVASVVRP